MSEEAMMENEDDEGVVIIEHDDEFVAASPQPDRRQAETFARLLFSGLAGFVNVRAVQEPKPAQGKPDVRNWWYPIDDQLPTAVGDYVEWCARNGFAAFLVPFAAEQQTRDEAGLLSTQFFVIDLDKGAIDQNCEKLTQLLGAPYLTVHSGGTENGSAKRHLWYRLAAPVGRSDFANLAQVRLQAAAAIGGDSTVAKNLGQPMRIPGSLHRKGEAQLCRIFATSETPGLLLADYVTRLIGRASIGPRAFGIDFSHDVPPLDIKRVLTQPVLAEGKSADGLTRYEAAGSAIGHYIRNMRDPTIAWSEAEARQAARDWNAAEMSPPWDDARLMQDFDRLLRRDVERNGPIPSALAVQQSVARAFRLSDWTMREYTGKAPEQRWLVDKTFPLGDAGILAGDGGIGKSFLALDLCFRVATLKQPASVLDFSQREIFGGQIMESGSAVFITAEETKAALHRRLETLDPNKERDALGDRLSVVSLRELGGGRSFIGGKSQGYPMTDFAQKVLDELLTKKADLRLAILDPLAVFYGAEGNDRTAVQAFANVLNHMASETGATVIALHHMRKDGDGSARKNILGSGGFVDAFRFAYTLQRAPSKEAKALEADYGLDPDHGELVLGSLVKTNGSAEGGEQLYERQSNGVLRQLPRRIDIAKAAWDAQRALLVEAVDWYANYGQPFTKTGKGSGLWANKQSLPPDLRELSQRRLEGLADDALGLGELQVAAAGKEKRQHWLCKPGSKVAEGRLRDFTPGARPAWEVREAA